MTFAKSLMASLPLLFVIAIFSLGVAGCDQATSCAASVGVCNDHVDSAKHCGIELECQDNKPRQLKCTPPDDKLPMSCECIESGTAQKTVALASKLPNDPDQAVQLAADQCGWKIK